MRTNFNIKSRGGRNKTAAKGIVVVTLVIVFLILLQTLSINPFGSVVHGIVRPVLQIQNTLASETQAFFLLLKSKRILIKENEILQERLLILEPSAYLVDALKTENAELKALLTRRVAENSVLAAVLAKPSLSLYDTLIIDVGTTNGVSEGDEVIVYGNFVIGVISKVYAKSALVTLFSSQGNVSEVTLGDKHLLVKAHGRGGGNFETRLPRGIAVAVGDIVIIPNISTRIFSTVERVVASPADQFQTIFFKNPINISDIRWVEVVTTNT
jgi:cell shape-determining protein MreC